MDTKINKEVLELGKEYSGKKFNELTKGINFVKLTGESEIHNKVQYKTGLNKDRVKFNPILYGEGGLYFCDIKNFPKFIPCEYKHCVNMRRVLIPDDARIYVDYEIFKADMFILSEPIKIFDDYKLCVAAVEHDGYFLAYVKNQTLDLCIKAINNNPLALKYVKVQTEEMCMNAVKNCELALQYVRDQTPEICIESVRYNGFMLQYVKEQTQQICIEAVRNNGCALEYVKDQTIEICIEAVKNNCHALKYVKKQTPEICFEAVKKYGYALKYVINQTPELCEIACKNDATAIQYVKTIKENTCLECIIN